MELSINAKDALISATVRLTSCWWYSRHWPRCSFGRYIVSVLVRHHQPDRGAAQDESFEPAENWRGSRCVGYCLELLGAGWLRLPDRHLGRLPILEVDTTGGPWYGEPHGDPSFLAPGEVADPRQTTRVKSLAALAKECTKATFFIVGERLALHPEIAKEVAEQAHTIGTHTWSHPNLARLSLPDVKREIEATFDAAQIASPAPVAPFFRYPCLSSSKLAADYLKSRNIGQFAMDIDSSDWRVRSSKSVIKKVMAVSKRGAAASS